MCWQLTASKATEMRQNGYGSTFKKNLGNGVMIMMWKSSSERKKPVCFWLYTDTRGHRYGPRFGFDISKEKPLKALITVPPLRFYTIILNNEIVHRRGCALNRLTLSKYFVSMALQEADLRSHQCPSETLTESRCYLHFYSEKPSVLIQWLLI